MSNPSQIEFEKAFSEKLTIHKNLQQEVIVTTVDKIRICLMNNLDKMTSKQEWVAPLGILVTLSATLFTTTFKDFYLKAEVWQAIHIISSVIVLAWFIKSIYKAWTSPPNGSIDSIIDELKNSQKTFPFQDMLDFVLKKPIGQNVEPKK